MGLLKLVIVLLVCLGLVFATAWALDTGVVSEEKLLWIVLPVGAVAVGLIVGLSLRALSRAGRSEGSD